MTTDAELYLHNRLLIAAEAELFGSSADGARVFRAPGVVASVNPNAPDRSLFNWAIASDGASLLSAYPQLSQCYSDAGVRAWTVWLDPGDEVMERELAARGHALDARPQAMGADIADLELPDAGDLAWRETHDVEVLAALNDGAFGFPPPAFRAALTRISSPRWHAYVALEGERVACCVMIWDSELGDAGVTCVATLPEFRGRALAARLLGVALRAAAERGARTTTLQATSKGAPVYERLGYRALGAMSMWEHRLPAPQG